jgi:hypothetical protein
MVVTVYLVSDLPFEKFLDLNFFFEHEMWKIFTESCVHLVT